jgi:type I restriction enzyme S subunit
MSSEMFLGDIAEITMGQSPAGIHCNKEGNGFPLLNGPTEFGDRHPFPVQFTTDPKKKANRGDLLFCVRGSTTGRMNWADQEYSIGRGIAAIRGKNGYPNSFVRTLIESQLEVLLVQATGSTFPNVSGKMLSELSVPEISSKSASEIAGLVEPIDDRIALLRETNSTLESIAQAIFKSWFIDFDPVRAKQEGREPEAMDTDTASFFPDSFEDSELGLLPAGWRILPLGEAVNIVGGGTPNTKDASFWEPGEFAWTTPKDLSGMQSPVLLKTERLLSAKGVSNVSSGLLPVGTLLLSSRAPIGYLAITQIPVSINQGYIAILPNSKLPPLYMLFWCRQNMDIIKSHSNGSTFMEISKRSFRPIPAFLPSASVLRSYLDLVEPVFQRLIENEKQVQTLASIRDGFLPRLISGQLSVSDANTDPVSEAFRPTKSSGILNLSDDETGMEACS